MAKSFAVPFSALRGDWGLLTRACKYEQEKERLIKRKKFLKDQLAKLPALIDECDREIEEHSLERWRVK